MNIIINYILTVTLLATSFLAIGCGENCSEIEDKHRQTCGVNSGSLILADNLTAEERERRMLLGLLHCEELRKKLQQCRDKNIF